MSAKKKALGRGLSALLEGSELEQAPREVQVNQLVGSVAMILIDDIEANPFQPRTDFDRAELADLAMSIQHQGIIQPVTLRKLGNDRFQLIAGERRLKAARVAGLTEIPAYIRVANDEQMLEMALVENIQREDLNPIEVGVSFQRLMEECQIKQEELSQRIGKDRSTISNYVRLLKLPAEIQIAIREKKITMGHARALITLENTSLQLRIFKQILSKNLSVREVESLVRKANTNTSPLPGSTMENPDPKLVKIEEQLTTRLNAPVKVLINKKGKGTITIPFHTEEELEKLLDLLGSNIT
ncbi:MAG: ParB/RepB/Spo0J family partition protein [Bacteroidales bacterium]|nr:ParB/RepB/Spo0J family partition protein [Bacteroidales bacterium]